MADHETHDYWEARGLVWLWLAMLAGPLAAGLHLQVGYALVKPACGSRQTWILVGVAAVCGALAIAGAWLGWRCLVRIGPAKDEGGGRRLDRSYLMATVAIGLDLLLLLFIVTSTFPILVLSPCE